MSDGTGISWTDATWNPIRGCNPVSPGCLYCYAAKMAYRLQMMGQHKYRSLTVLRNGIRTFNGVVDMDDDALTIPLHWKKPRRIFVNSMSDLFYEQVPFEFVDKVFAVMALCPQHTFQVLTKRPERAAEYMGSRKHSGGMVFLDVMPWGEMTDEQCHDIQNPVRWPLPNVWLGTSVEDQKRADERIPWLLRCPAAVRFLSCEPLLGPIDLAHACPCGYYCDESNNHIDHPFLVRQGQCHGGGIHWVIAGGESGPGARPCNVGWIGSIVRQCKAAGVACWVKQLGSRAVSCLDQFITHESCRLELKHPKGGDIAEWPEDLRVQEMPC